MTRTLPWLVTSCSERTTSFSVAERPEPQPFLGQLPEPREAERLEDQEHDDENAEDDLLERGCDGGVDRLAEHRVKSDVQEHRHQQDEARAQEGTHDGAEPDDNDHEQDAERQRSEE